MKIFEVVYQVEAFVFDHRAELAEVIKLVNSAFENRNLGFRVNQKELIAPNGKTYPFHVKPRSYAHEMVDEINGSLGRATGGDWRLESVRTFTDEYCYALLRANENIGENEANAVLGQAKRAY
jgi:hypothetical protein